MTGRLGRTEQNDTLAALVAVGAVVVVVGWGGSTTPARGFRGFPCALVGGVYRRRLELLHKKLHGVGICCCAAAEPPRSKWCTRLHLVPSDHGVRRRTTTRWSQAPCTLQLPNEHAAADSESAAWPDVSLCVPRTQTPILARVLPTEWCTPG